MFEKLMIHGAALARRAAERRRAELGEDLRDRAPPGIRASVEEEQVVLAGRGLRRRLALEPAFRWLLSGRGR